MPSVHCSAWTWAGSSSRRARVSRSPRRQQVPGPSPTPNDFEFEDAIINTYHAIEPWVRYGFEVATYAVGWIPWVGWLAPQIMIFYNFGERIVESLVVNSANWLWGPLPFCEGLGNVAEDSWNALLQLGRDQWNFWLPPLPPLPFDAQEAQTQLAAAETLAPADQSVASPTVKPHPLRDALAALHRFLAGPDAVVPEDVDPQEGVDPQEKEVDLQGKVDPQDKGDLQDKGVLQEMGDLQDKGDLQDEADLHVNEPALVDAQRVSVPASPGDDAQVKADPPQTDATPTASVEPKTDPPAGKPKPFAKKPKPAVETPDSPVRPSKKSAGASNGSGETSNDSVGTPNPSKNRVDGPKKHRSAGSPSGTAANSPDGS